MSNGFENTTDSADDVLRGASALFASLTADRKRGSGAPSNRAGTPVNVAHQLLLVAPRPLNAIELAAHAVMGGFWVTNAAKPEASFIHPVTSAVKDDPDCVLEKTPGKGGFYRVKADAPDPLPIARIDVSAEPMVVGVSADGSRIFEMTGDVYTALIDGGKLVHIDIDAIPTI